MNFQKVAFSLACRGVNHCKSDNCFHSMPSRFIYRFPDLVRCEGLTLLSCDIFLLPSFYVHSFKYIKACVTGCRFSLRLMYALMTARVALTGKIFCCQAVEQRGGVYSFIVLSAARRLPMSRWCGGSVCLCVVLFWYAIRRLSGLPYLSRGVPVAAVSLCLI